MQRWWLAMTLLVLAAGCGGTKTADIPLKPAPSDGSANSASPNAPGGDMFLAAGFIGAEEKTQNMAEKPAKKSSGSTPQFNDDRLTPYKNSKYRVLWDGKAVAGSNKISWLSPTGQVVRLSEDAVRSDTRKSPGQLEYGAIMLERGVTHDPEFELWANRCWMQSSGVGKEFSLKEFRKDISIEILNEAGQKVVAYKVYRCWVSSYTALPDLDADANAVAIQSMKLENEGWELDGAVPEPDLPRFDGEANR